MLKLLSIYEIFCLKNKTNMLVVSLKIYKQIKKTLKIIAAVLGENCTENANCTIGICETTLSVPVCKLG